MTVGANFDLTGKVALVTGGTRGIGLAIAEAYAAAGAQVVVASRKQSAVDEATELIRRQGGEVLGLAAHTGEPETASALVAQTVAHFGGLDILVNNAATNPHFGPFLSAEESHWDKILDVNVKGYRLSLFVGFFKRLSRKNAVNRGQNIGFARPAAWLRRLP